MCGLWMCGTCSYLKQLRVLGCVQEDFTFFKHLLCLKQNRDQIPVCVAVSRNLVCFPNHMSIDQLTLVI